MSDILEITENLIDAADLIEKTTSHETKAAKSDNEKVIHEMLLSIASSGIKNKDIFEKSEEGFKRHRRPKHGTYRGAC